MKITIAILAMLVIVAVAASARAQDWVFDWTSNGHVAVIGGDGRLSGSSPATFHDGLAPLPPNFATPSSNLNFSANGHDFYGGLVAPGNFQTTGWAVPAPDTSFFGGRFSAGFASGTLTFSDPNDFTLNVLVGSGHAFAELNGVGHRVTAATPEPATLTVGAIGLLGALLRRGVRRPSGRNEHR